MKKIVKLWDVFLLAVIGIIGSGCILDPPIPEYGVEPMYGVQAEVQDSDSEHLEGQTE